MPSTYKQIAATSQVKSMAGVLKGIFVSAAASTPTIKIYDSAVSSTDDPALIDTFTPVAGTNYNFFDGIYAGKGLYVVISGTVKATVYFD